LDQSAAYPAHIDLREVEREICRLSDVSVVRFVQDDRGAVVEVHVIAAEGKHPKQIARDVQSVALASFGLTIDRRIISVVQLGAAAEANGHHPSRRTAITGITAEASGLRSLVRVTLVREGNEAVGSAQGSVATTARHRLVANATVDALRRLDPAAGSIDVDQAEITRVGAHDVALVTVVFVAPPSEEVVAGAAVVHAQQDADAVARAVLDATNRRLGRHDNGHNGHIT
jgi:hypothetical protein